MSTYITRKCPYCNKALEFMNRSEFYDYNRKIGLPICRCPYCNQLYKTGLKLYYQMSADEKSKLSLNKIMTTISAIFSIWALIFIISIFIFNNIVEDYIFNIFAITIIISIPLGILLGIKKYIEIKNIGIEEYNLDNELIVFNKLSKCEICEKYFPEEALKKGCCPECYKDVIKRLNKK